MAKPPVRTETMRNLGNVDLNLLVTFEALWLERSVTGAGRRLGLSQPATSAALARLRAMTGDRLFVRGKTALEPTERCAELAQAVRREHHDAPTAHRRRRRGDRRLDPASARARRRRGTQGAGARRGDPSDARDQRAR
jgi:DNA-binding transcriptional LysR family regulator